MSAFSDYIVYADESGSPDLAGIDPSYPVFVLSLCVFHKEDYVQRVVPELMAFKFHWFGNDMPVLHSHKIRKQRPPFDLLVNPRLRGPFLDHLSTLVRDAPFTLIAAAIHKQRHVDRYPSPFDPYPLAVMFCLERLYAFLRDQDQTRAVTHVVLESRGHREDRDLELAFRRVCQGNNDWRAQLPLEPVFAHKKANSAGLQLADLVGHPIGVHVLRPTQPNRAWAHVEPKFRRSPSGQIRGWGLKLFP